jgi:hypothetical protein
VRPRAGRVGIFNDDDIVGLGSEQFRALRRVQNKLRADGELAFLEFTQTAVNCSQISVDKKDVERAVPVLMRVLRAHTPYFRTGLALCQVCHLPTPETVHAARSNLGLAAWS